MLTIKTDIKNRNWLEYILDEFRRINAAQFDCNVVDVHDPTPSDHFLFYTTEFIGKPAIPNRSSLPPDSVFVKHSDSIFILQNTKVDDKRFLINYDILWNAFVVLSRLEEFMYENTGRKIHSYSRKHPRNDKTTFDIPLVNNYFDELEALLHEHFPDLVFSGKETPFVELSHDVDYIEKTPQLFFKQSVFNLFNSLTQISRPVESLRSARKAVFFCLSNPSYWCFDYWTELEKSMKVRSVFYIYARATSKNFTSWLLDPSYDISRHSRLRDKLKNLIEEGFSVGLHGSVQSARNEHLMKKEVDVLSTCLDCEIIKVRQHWLCYEENSTPYIHNLLFEYDSTLGWNDRIGFRSGCASMYRPFDHKNQRPFDFIEIPLIIMDSTIFDYGADNVEINQTKAFELLYLLQRYKRVHVAISWHQRVCASDYQWNQFYESILKRL